MDDKTALDLLSSDFERKTTPVQCDAAAAELVPPVLDSTPLKVESRDTDEAHFLLSTIYF